MNGDVGREQGIVISPRYLLWVDCSAALLAGAAVFLLSHWLSDLYALPQGFLRGIAAVNTVYGLFSFSIAIRARRSRALITALVLANATWAVLCGIAAAVLVGKASLLGVTHLVIEGMFVGWLARMEWTQRENLLLGP